MTDGIDPGEHRKATKTAKADSLEAVAREWHAKHAPLWVASHADKIIRRLERDVFPWLGARPIGEVTAPELLTVLRRIESRVHALERTWVAPRRHRAPACPRRA